MSTLIIVILSLIFILLALNKKEHLLKHGHYVRSKSIYAKGHHFYVEEVKFDNYQEALHKFYKIVDDVSKIDQVLEVKYDLYNWTYSYFRFQDYTIELKHHRSYNKVQLIKSKKALSIEEFQLSNPYLKP